VITRVKRIILNNIGLKLLSLALAVVLWYLISARGVSEVTIEVPIEYVNIPQGYEIVQKSVDRVSITLFGSERILRSLKTEDLRVTVDMKGKTEGDVKYKITKKDIRIPSAVNVSEIEPSQVEVLLDRTETKTVPVIVSLTGEVKDKYRIEIKPSEVVIAGPSSILKKVRYVTTDRIDLEEIGDNTVKRVRVHSEFERVRLLTDTVEIRFIKKEAGR
jgi:YbbR domain-containing protein